MTRLASLLITTLLGMSVLPGVAGAQQPPASVTEERKTELNELFKKGAEDYKAKRYADALPRFQQVFDELGSPNALLYVARCLREMGRYVEAYDTMDRTQQLAAKRAQTEPRFQETAKAAGQELLEIRQHVARVTVTVPSAPPGTVVEVAGRGVALGEMVAVAPGSVRVEVRPPGRAALRRDLQVPAGLHEQIAVQLVAAPAPSPAGPAPLPSPGPEATHTVQTGGFVRYIGIGVLGLGAVGWAGLIVGGIVSDNKFEDVERSCNLQRCTTDDQDKLIEEGRAYELAANIGIAVGAAGTIAGTLLIIFGGPSEETVPVTGAVLPGGGFVGYGGTF